MDVIVSIPVLKFNIEPREIEVLFQSLLSVELPFKINSASHLHTRSFLKTNFELETLKNEFASNYVCEI